MRGPLNYQYSRVRTSHRARHCASQPAEAGIRRVRLRRAGGCSARVLSATQPAAEQPGTSSLRTHTPKRAVPISFEFSTHTSYSSISSRNAPPLPLRACAGPARGRRGAPTGGGADATPLSHDWSSTQDASGDPSPIRHQGAELRGGRVVEASVVTVLACLSMRPPKRAPGTYMGQGRLLSETGT